MDFLERSPNFFERFPLYFRTFSNLFDQFLWSFAFAWKLKTEMEM